MDAIPRLHVVVVAVAAKVTLVPVVCPMKGCETRTVACAELAMTNAATRHTTAVSFRMGTCLTTKVLLP